MNSVKKLLEDFYLEHPNDILIPYHSFALLANEVYPNVKKFDTKPPITICGKTVYGGPLPLTFDNTDKEDPLE